MKKNIVKVTFIKDCEHEGKGYREGRVLTVREWFADELVKAKKAKKQSNKNKKEMEVSDFEQLKVQKDIEEIKTKEEKFKSRKTK